MSQNISEGFPYLPTSADTSDRVRIERSSFTAVTALMKAASWAPDSVSNSPAEITGVITKQEVSTEAYLVLLSLAESCILGLG